jgi:hypothetical protein
MDDEDLEARGFGIGDWLKAIGGVLFFIAGLLPWWSYSFESSAGSLQYDDNAFDFSDGVVAYVIFVAIAVVTIISQTGSLRLPTVLVHPALLLVAAFIGTGLVGYRFFADDSENGSRGLGMYLAAAGALLVLVGCVLAYLDHRRYATEDDDDELFDTPPSRDGRALHRPSPPLP